MAVVPLEAARRPHLPWQLHLYGRCTTPGRGANVGEIARKLNVTFEPVTAKSFVEPLLPSGETWTTLRIAAACGWNGEANPQTVKPVGKDMQWTDPAFAGDALQFPLQFQPYLSIQYHDGRGSNLPWMQELPDPASSAMWDFPVEIDPKTASNLNVVTGDWVRVESANGRLDAPAYVHPAALPGVISMAIGEGHTHYGRYASGRGANPLSFSRRFRNHRPAVSHSGQRACESLVWNKGQAN